MCYVQCGISDKISYLLEALEMKDKMISQEKYLTKKELLDLYKAVKNFYSDKDKNFRNYLIIKVCYLHGLRVSEVLSLGWQDVNLNDGLIYCRRLKDSISSNQIMRSDEIKELKRLKKLNWSSKLVFCNRDGTAISRFTLNKMLNKLSLMMDIDKKITPHCLKHTCGVHLALAGKNIREIQHHLGHRDLKNTMIYLNYSPTGDANNLI